MKSMLGAVPDVQDTIDKPQLSVVKGSMLGGPFPWEQQMQVPLASCSGRSLTQSSESTSSFHDPPPLLPCPFGASVGAILRVTVVYMTVLANCHCGPQR